MKAQMLKAAHTYAGLSEIVHVKPAHPTIKNKIFMLIKNAFLHKPLIANCNQSDRMSH